MCQFIFQAMCQSIRKSILGLLCLSVLVVMGMGLSGCQTVADRPQALLPLGVSPSVPMAEQWLELAQEARWPALRRRLLAQIEPELSVTEKLQVWKALWNAERYELLRLLLMRSPGLPQEIEGAQDIFELQLRLQNAELRWPRTVSEGLLELFAELGDGAQNFWHLALYQAILSHDEAGFSQLLRASAAQATEAQLDLFKASALKALNIAAFEQLGGRVEDELLRQPARWTPFLRRPYQGGTAVLRRWLAEDILPAADRQTLLSRAAGDNSLREHHPQALALLGFEGFMEQNAQGISPLQFYLASPGASLAWVAELLPQALNLQDANGHSLLFFAARGGASEIVVELLRLGLAPQLRSAQQEGSHGVLVSTPPGSSALTQALTAPRLDAFFALLPELDPQAEPRDLLALALQRLPYLRADNLRERALQSQRLRPLLRFLWAQGLPVEREALEQGARLQSPEIMRWLVQAAEGPNMSPEEDLSPEKGAESEALSQGELADLTRILAQSFQLHLDEELSFSPAFLSALLLDLERRFVAEDPQALLLLNQSLQNILQQAQARALVLEPAQQALSSLRDQELRLLARLGLALNTGEHS